jgi:predicted O-methyltransferase YrrM
MLPLDAHLLEQIDAYIEKLFVRADPFLEKNLRNANAAGLEAIQVSPNQGKLLWLLAKLSRAQRILEIGVLGGYSATWLGRAMPSGGRLIGLEISPRAAEVARENLRVAGLDHCTEIRVGPAAQTLRAMIAAGEQPFDLIFIDADKSGYTEYLELSMRLTRPGTLILADNVIRGGGVMEEIPPDENARGARDFNAALAAHPNVDAIVLPILRWRVDGLAIGIVK